MKFIYTFLCLFASTFCFAQGQLRGKVSHANGTPAQNINITLEKTNYITVTDEKREFNFSALPADTYTLKASAVNYLTRVYSIKITKGKTTNLQIEMHLANT